MNSMSFSTSPLEVMAGVPTRIPEVWNGDLESKGTMFLFTVMSACLDQFPFRYFSCQIRELCPQVDKHEMIVRTAGHYLVSFCLECFSHGESVCHYLFLVFREFRLKGFVKRYGLGRDTVLKRTSLYAWEYAGIEYLRHLLHDTFRGSQSPWIVEILAAISPAVCAMSTMKMAPTLSAIRLILSQSHSLEYADAPPMISFGLYSRAFFSMSL